MRKDKYIGKFPRVKTLNVDKLVVELIKPEEHTKSGLLLNGLKSQKPQIGIIRKMSPALEKDESNMYKVGDTVMFYATAGEDLKLTEWGEEKDFRILRFNEVQFSI